MSPAPIIYRYPTKTPFILSCSCRADVKNEAAVTYQRLTHQVPSHPEILMCTCRQKTWLHPSPSLQSPVHHTWHHFQPWWILGLMPWLDRGPWMCRQKNCSYPSRYPHFTSHFAQHYSRPWWLFMGLVGRAMIGTRLWPSHSLLTALSTGWGLPARGRGILGRAGHHASSERWRDWELSWPGFGRR